MFKEKIRAGFKLLDKNKPDWLDSVDVDKLKMTVPTRKNNTEYGCTLCQIYGSFDKGVRALGINGYGNYKYGFVIHSTSNWDILTNEVIELIIELKEKQK